MRTPDQRAFLLEARYPADTTAAAGESETEPAGVTIEYPANMQQRGYTEPVVLETMPQRVACLSSSPVLALYEMGVPMIAIPTTAGTGSEVTSFSVITDHSRNYKLSVSSNYLLPSYAILDPELIASVPAGTAAACGVDAMVHALEAYLSLAASPFSDMFALKALHLIGKNLRAYAANRGNEAAAEAMMMGSLFAGIAFSHARLGDVHAMSHPVSAYFNVAHGVANAILLPVIVEYNELADQGKYYDIYRCVAKAPVPEAMFYSHMLTEELRALNMELGIPSCLKDAGVKAEYFDAMAEDAMKSGNISVNPRSTTKADVLELYKKAF